MKSLSAIIGEEKRYVPNGKEANKQRMIAEAEELIEETYTTI